MTERNDAAEPIAARGSDLSDATTHGVEPGGTERRGPATGERAGADAATGIGGATSGEPAHDHDPAVPPGRRVDPRAETDPDRMPDT